MATRLLKHEGPGGAPSTPGSKQKQATAWRQRLRQVVLVERARGGDRAAFDALWTTYARTVQRVVNALVPDHEVEDVMQDAAFASWSSIHALREAERLPAWLCTIARNCARDTIKKRRQAPTALPDADVLPAAPTMPSTTEEVAGIVAVIRSLPPCYREPLLLRLLLDMSGREIAARTGKTPGSVRVNLCRGMRILRARLWRSAEPEQRAAV